MVVVTTTAVRERPILFSGPMVRAILAGQKTVTRRVVKPQPAAGVRRSPFAQSGLEDGHGCALRPHAFVGDRLWVRETWSRCIGGAGELVNYRADGETCRTCGKQVEIWASPILMRRVDSRITLEITAVRVERLQEITEADAIAEGMPAQRPAVLAHPLKPTRNMACAMMACTHREAFQHGWDALNAKRGYSWASNPWVWCVEFRRIDA